MSLFGKIKSKIFGNKTPIHKSFNRKEEDAAIYAAGQAARRKALLERRVKAGTSAKVYKNKKTLNTLEHRRWNERW